jgi:hypothetical protein
MKTQKQIFGTTVANNANDQEQIARTLWFMAFVKLMKQGFSMEFSTNQATTIAERQIKELFA